MKRILLIFLVAIVSVGATVGWQNRNFVADTFQFTGGSVRTNFGPTILSSNTTPITITNTSVETNLMTYTMPANTLSVNGDEIFIEAYINSDLEVGSFLTLNFYFGSNAFLTFANDGSSTSVARNYHQVYLTRISSSTLLISVFQNDHSQNTSEVVLGDLATGIDFTTTNVIKFTGFFVVADPTNLITQYLMNVWKRPVVN